MKENQGWREAYNKIIFEQVDINEETIPNFVQQEINKAVLEERGHWKLAIMHLPTEQRESVIKTFEYLSTLTTK